MVSIIDANTRVKKVLLFWTHDIFITVPISPKVYTMPIQLFSYENDLVSAANGSLGFTDSLMKDSLTGDDIFHPHSP